MLDLALLRGISALAVHFAEAPAAFILSAIWPLEDAVALLVIVEVLTLVLATVRPSEDSVAMHFVVLPIAVELTAVFPRIGSFAVDVVLEEITFV